MKVNHLKWVLMQFKKPRKCSIHGYFEFYPVGKSGITTES